MLTAVKLQRAPESLHPDTPSHVTFDQEDNEVLTARAQ